MDFLDLIRDFLEDLFRERRFAKSARIKKQGDSRKVNKLDKPKPALFGTSSSETTSNHRSIDTRVLCLLFIFEAGLFFAVYNLEMSWYPPANFYSATYLMSTYR